MRSTRSLFQVALFSILTIFAGCGGGGGGGDGGGGGGGGGGGSGSSDVYPPLFRGLQSIATAGGASVRIDWKAGDDESGSASLTYRAYAASTSGGQDFSSPVLTTGAGETSAILTSATTPLVAVGTTVFLVVRATDADGNEDRNTVELHAIPVPAGNVAFVSDTAAGGTLGDPSDPFPTIQEGIDAVEGAAGGVVLVDAANGGTTYTPAAGGLTMDTTVGTIGLFGGFARFSTLGPGATGADILASRDVTGNETRIAGDGAEELIDVANALSPTYVDGFTFDETRPVDDSITGTLVFEKGRTAVRGIGTSFGSELGGGDVIRLEAGGPCVQVDSVRGDELLLLSVAYRGENATGAASVLDDSIRAITATDAAVQISGNRLLCGAEVLADTTTTTTLSRISFVGNTVLDAGTRALTVGGGIRSLRFDANHVTDRGQPLEHGETATGFLHVATIGCSVHVAQNLLEDNRGGFDESSMVDLSFAPADPATGGDLTILIEGNEMRNHSGSSVDLDNIADVGANGSVDLTVRFNICNGPSADGVEITTMAGDPFPGVDISVAVHDNTISNTDSIGIDIDVGVAAGRTTDVNLSGNLLAIGESEMIELRDQRPGTSGASDGGVITINISRNIGLGGFEDLETEVGVAPNGRTHLQVVENTVLSSEDMGMNLDLESYIGLAATDYPFPNGVYCFNLFNNDIEGHDDEGVEIEDARSAGSLAVGYIGFNYIQSGADGNDGALDFRQFGADDSGWLIHRSMFGLGGSEGTEAGIEFDLDPSSVRNDLWVMNCTATLASGGGFEFHIDSAQVQCINNTCAFNGINGNSNANFENHNSSPDDGNGQVYILNCIGSHAGGGSGDFDVIGGFRPIYSLARDDSLPGGLGNLSGEPFYDADVTSFPFPISNQYLTTLFRLRDGSPAIDAGHPAARYNDPDGSRNDMGAYGGPGAGPIGPTAAGTAVPFVFVSTYPSVNLHSGSVLVEDDDTIWFGFTRPVDDATLGSLSITSGGAAVPGTLTTVAGGHLVRFVPDTVLTPGASDFVTVSIGAGLADTSGQAIDRASSFRFAVQPTIVIAEATNDDGSVGLTLADLTAAQMLDVGAAPAVFDVTGNIASTTDDDVYAITVSAGDRLMATLVDARNDGGENGAVSLDLYDANLNRITEGRRRIFNDVGASDGDTYVDHTFATGGTYYIVISNRDTAGSNHILRAILDN